MGPLRVALTGGIASGKSMVCQYFRGLQIPIIDADHIAHHLLSKDSAVISKVVALFGARGLREDGQIDRKKIREIIFEHPDQRKSLEALLHPIIFRRIAQQCRRVTTRYCIISVPLLIETNTQALFDRIIVIDVSEKMQVQRLIKRDGVSMAIATKILKAQASRAQRQSFADDIISNFGDLAALAEQVKTLHHLYMGLRPDI